MSTTATLEKKENKLIVDHLCILLADTYLLYVKTQNFHWNVCDPRFHSLHEFFEEQYEKLAEAVDLIAERIRAIGAKAPGTMQQFLSLSRLDEAKGCPKGEEMLKELLHDNENLAQWLRSEVDFTAQNGDQGTSDLCIGRLREHEKTAWMLRSHLGGAS